MKKVSLLFSSVFLVINIFVQCNEQQSLHNKLVSIIKIKEKNIDVYHNLAQAYEAEFSNLTKKVPDVTGIFFIDTEPIDSYEGYLLYKKEIPIGFCIVDVKNEIRDIAEFYIIPSMRRQLYGSYFAKIIFKKYPGKWYVRQIEGATKATKFWANIIKKVTNNNYKQEVVYDDIWGIVTRQSFTIY